MIDFGRALSLRSLRWRAIAVLLVVAAWPLWLVPLGVAADVQDGLPYALVVAAVLGWWLGWRMVLPLERLRDQVRDKAILASAQPDLDLQRGDEFDELAEAINNLLRQLQERAEGNERFAADIAHEIKNQLAAVRAVGEVLASGAPDAPRSQRLGRVLADSSRRLDALTSELLDLARIEAGLAGEHRERFDLAVLTQALVEAIAQDERWAGKLEVRCDAESAEVLGVSQRIEAALRNLLVNACSFAAGRVDVEVRCVAGRVRVRVQDDGAGVPSADRPKVFQRFFTTRPGAGTGLGLALVRAVAEAHGGRAWIDEGPSTGAMFCLDLPCAAASQRPSDTLLGHV